jgi:hypothetical protein
MRRQTIGFGVFCLAFWLLTHHAVAGGGQTVTPSQTQSTSSAGVLVATDWGPGTKGLTNPLIFNQFNPKLGTLISIDFTLTTTIRNDYELIFPTSSTPTTIDVATTETTNPIVLANPATRATLTDGPNVTLFGPDRTTQIFGALGTRQPVDFVQLTESGGTYSSLLPIASPDFIQPTVTQQSFSRTVTSSGAPLLFSAFIGTGTVNLPVTATAFSSFYSSSGNGGGAVFTEANAVVTIDYSYIAAQQITSPTPEPATIILLGLGIGITLAARKLRRCASRTSRNALH